MLKIKEGYTLIEVVWDQCLHVSGYKWNMGTAVNLSQVLWSVGGIRQYLSTDPLASQQSF